MESIAPMIALVIAVAVAIWFLWRVIFVITGIIIALCTRKDDRSIEKTVTFIARIIFSVIVLSWVVVGWVVVGIHKDVPDWIRIAVMWSFIIFGLAITISIFIVITDKFLRTLRKVQGK